MKAFKRKSGELRPAEQARAFKPLDSGETRAIMIGAVMVAVFLYWIKLILLPFVLAGIIAFVCTPLLDWAAERTRWPRLLFAIAAFLVLVSAATTFAVYAGERLMSEAQATAGDLQRLLENFTGQALGDKSLNLFGTTMNAQQIVQAVMERLRDWFGQTDQLAALTGYSVVGIMGAFLTVVLLFYFLVSGRRVAGGIFWIVPPHRRPLVARIWERLDPLLMRYFIGILGVIAYTTVAAYVGLGVILNIRHAVLLALLTGVLEVVPVIGPTSAAIIAGLISLRAAAGIVNIAEYALYATLLRLSIDQLVAPVILGRAAHVHPVLIIFCFLAGSVVLGVPGIILAVPIALVVKSTLATIYGEE
ncbi:MAG TPA: AI-2E family transporter [Xanthobacteraceae bacterium]|nr:AI-2E family transporter [Xanthobacteraceae bacterium]